MTEEDRSRFKEAKAQTPMEVVYRRSLEDYFCQSIGTAVEKLENFAKYVPRQRLTRFLGYYEMFKRIVSVQGSIVECGVLFGGGLMAWAQLSAILEPLNYQRRIIGFDTFAGFTEVSKEDEKGTSQFLHRGGLAVDAHEDLLQAVALYDSNRFLGHIPKVELVKGDICKTVPEYLESHPHIVVSLLYLDVDVFKPTRAAIEHFVPRMPKGAIIAFDELNSQAWPGETIAALNSIGIRNLRIERFAFDTMPSFAVLD